MRGSPVERAIFLCSGDPDTCHNCGGWTRAEVDGVAGPFPGDSRFCSEECWESYEEMDARDRERIEKDFCRKCGFDRGKHADGCQA